MAKIQWTEKTWNPLAGCSIVSTECRECYAMKLAHRLAKMGQEKYQGLTEVRNGHVVWNGTVRLDRDALNIPYGRKKPTLYFVNSMSDMFHESLSHDDICSIWSVMVVCDRHRYQVLTKRPARMREFVNGWIQHMRAGSLAPVENVWLGTSVGYRLAKPRIDELRETNAAIRFLSLEPLLEDLGELDLRGIRWVIVGGESGPDCRPCNASWIRSIVHQCIDQHVAVFVKQLGKRPFDSDYGAGTFAPEDKRSIAIAKELHMDHIGFNLILPRDAKGGDILEFPKDLQVREYPAERVLS